MQTGAPLVPRFEGFHMLKMTMTVAALSIAGLFNALPSAHATETQAAKLCAFPLSPTKNLDIEVTKAVFEKMSLGYEVVDLTQDLGTESTSEFAISKLLKSKCDLFVGIPISVEDMQFRKGMAISVPYLNVKFVKFRYPGAKLIPSAHGVVAVAYETPGQIIAAEEGDRNIEVENTTDEVIEAVVSGRAEYGIGWYPSLQEYKSQHQDIQFAAQNTNTKISSWSLSFVADAHNAALISKISGALRRLSSDVAFQGMIKPWEFESGNTKMSASSMGAIQPTVFTFEAEHQQDEFRLINVSDTSVSAAPQANFAPAQLGPGKKLFAAQCAKCHGGNLQGYTAPALKGAGFAPMKNSTMTIGGIYQYMMTNMPADKPGKLKPAQYADIMAYLLSENGYKPSGKKLDPNAVQDDQSEFNSFAQ